MLILSSLHENCLCKYDESPGSMESSWMTWMMRNFHISMAEYIYYTYIINDDGNSMRKHLTHPTTRPTGKKNVGGYLPKKNPLPEWFTDPAYCSKCVASELFELAKSVNSMKKLDTLRLKK